jgi:hypothetical protein
MRSALAWLARLALGVVLAAIVIVAMLLVTAHTGWGREQLRSRVEAALRDTFPGGAHVGALEGTVLGSLTLRDVELDRPDGKPLVTIAVLRVDLALWPLAIHTARVHDLVADGVHAVIAPSGPDAVPTRDTAPSPWRIELEQVAIQRAALELDAGGVKVALSDIAATGAGMVEHGVVTLFGWSHGRWAERGTELTAMAAVVLGSDIRVPAAYVTLGGATVAASGLTIDPISRDSRLFVGTGQLGGTLAVITSGRALAALFPELELSRDAADQLGEVLTTVDAGAAAPARGSGMAATTPSGGKGVAAESSAGRAGVAADSLVRDPVAAAGSSSRGTGVTAGSPSRGTGVGAGSPSRGTAGSPSGGTGVGAESGWGPWEVAVAAAAAPEMRLEVHARTEAGRLWASLRGDPARRIARGVVSVADVDLSEVTRGRWCGRGSAIAALDGSVDRVRGTVIVGGGLLGALEDLDRLRGAPVGSCGVAQAPGPAAIVALEATLDRATVAVIAGSHGAPHAFAVASAHRRGTAIELDDARAVARMQAVVAGGRRITGGLAVAASATGELAPALDLEVRGNTAGNNIAVDDVKVVSVQGPFEARVTAARVRGEAHLTAAGVRSGSTRIARIRADLANRSDGTYRVAATAWPDAGGLEIFADARVAPRGEQIVADIDRSRVTLSGGMTWAGRGGSVVVNPATIAVRGVQLHSGDASVALRGELARASGALVAHLAADRLAAVRIDERYRGVASGTLALARRGGAWSADGRLDLRDLGVDAANRSAPVNASAHLVLAGRRVTLDARASGAALGSAELVVDATAPRDPFDLRAWQALDRRALRSATITAHRVELSAVAALAVPPGRFEIREALRGTIDGAIDLAPGALHGGFAVRDVELPFAALDGDLTIAAQGADLGAHATARLSDLGSADLTARFAIPDRPFDPATWRRRGRDLLMEASAAVADVAIDPERLARLGVSNLLAAYGLDGPYRGRASAALTLDAAAADARLAIDVNDVIGGALVEPVTSRVAITAGPGGTHVQASLHARELSLGEIEGDVAMTLDRWIDDPGAVLRAPIAAGWTLPATAAAPVLALFGRRDLAAGAVDATVAVRGTLLAPAVAAHLGARELAVATRLGGRPPALLRDLEADASWDRGGGTLAIRGHEASGGELSASASGRLDALAAATGTMTARHFDIAPLAVVLTSVAPRLPGALVSAVGTVDADLSLASGRLGGALTLTGGALPIGAAVGTLRDASARVAIDDRAIHATVRGRLGRGTIDVTATAASDLITIDATLKLAGVSPIAALRPIIDADIDAKLHLGAERPCALGTVPARLCGDIAIKRARIALPDHGSTPLLDASAPDDLVFVEPDRAGGSPSPKPARGSPGPRPPAHPWLVANVTLDSTPVVAEDVAEGVAFHADVRSDQLAVSIGDTLGVRGRVEIDHADADVLGRRYVVEPSELIFEGTADPRLAIRMAHQFPELTLDVAVTGPASSPDLKLSSEPGGYTYDQLFGFFLGGEPGGDPNSQTREAVAGASARWLSGKLGRQINRVLPIKLDAVSCAPATSATTATGGSCTFGKWVTERLFVAYRQHLGGAPNENTGDVQVQIRMGRKVLIEGSGGDRGHHGADLLWRHRW